MTKLFLIAASTLLLASCASVGPDYQAPKNAVGVELEQSTYESAQQAASWWQHFEDPDLNQLVEMALDHNRTLVQAQANVERAYAVFRDADLENVPKGSLDTSYNASRNPTAATADDDVIVRTYQGGLSLSWDLDLVGKLRRAAEAANAEAQQADALWRDAQVQIISQVATSYGEYRAAQLRIQVAELNLDSLLKTRTVIEARAQAGLVSDLELTRIDAQVYDLKTQIPDYQLAMLNADATLSALLGQTPNALGLGGAQGLPELEQPLALSAGQISASEYLRYRADVAVAERALAARTAQIGIATADLYPQLSMTGFLGFLSGDSHFISSDQRSWSIAPTLSWQVANFATVQARIDAANASEKMALAEFEQTVINALGEMQLSLQGYNLSRVQLLMFEQQLQETSKAVSIARALYEAGSGDFLDLLDAERDLLDARDRLVQLQQQSFSRIVNVYKAFGGGFSV